MSPLLDRIGAFFLDPADPADTSTADPATERTAPLGLAPSTAERATRRGHAPPEPTGDAEPERPALRGFAPHAPTGEDAAFAAVLGGAPGVPVAAACAGEMRAQARAGAAVLCVWRGDVAQSGASTPAVRRIAARLAANGLVASACGRLAWVALDADEDIAVAEVARARALAGVPVVVAVAAPRPAVFEPLIAAADRAVVVLPTEADKALRELALATLPPHASCVAPLPPGPARWAAMAGLARLRALRESDG